MGREDRTHLPLPGSPRLLPRVHVDPSFNLVSHTPLGPDSDFGGTTFGLSSSEQKILVTLIISYLHLESIE